MPTTKTPRTTPAPAANKPAATTWQPAPGSHCYRAMVYMLTSGATHYRPAEIAAALGIRNGRVHEGLRPAIKAGAVFSVPDPAHGTFRLYTIAPGWQLQNQPAPDATEADPWPRQRWINADGTVRMDRTGAASTGATTSATTGTKADAPAPHPATPPAAEAAEPTAQTAASRTTCDTLGTCQGYQPPCPGCTRATPMPTITAATHHATTHRLTLHVDTDAQAIPGQATPKLKVEFMGGDDIIAACTEAVRIAKTVGCMVVFDFNGVHCMARAETDPLALADRWQAEIQKPAAVYRVAA